MELGALRPITSFGTWGRSAGEFNNPRFVLHLDGGVLISDSGNDRLQVVSPSGRHVKTFYGSQPGHPTGLATDGTWLWVADSSNCTVQKMRLADGQVQCRMGSWGEGDCQFNAPEGLALHAGILYVADEGNHRVVLLDAPTLKWRGAFGSRGSADGEFCHPVGLTVLDGEVYVRDANNHRIQVFSPAGEFRRAFGAKGSDRGKFIYPTGMAAVGSGRLLVSEAGAGRVQMLTKYGEPLDELPLPCAGKLYGMCVNEQSSTVFVADYGKHRLHVLSLT